MEAECKGIFFCTLRACRNLQSVVLTVVEPPLGESHCSTREISCQAQLFQAEGEERETAIYHGWGETKEAFPPLAPPPPFLSRMHLAFCTTSRVMAPKHREFLPWASRSKRRKKLFFLFLISLLLAFSLLLYRYWLCCSCSPSCYCLSYRFSCSCMQQLI